jgi:hypothetical protein
MALEVELARYAPLLDWTKPVLEAISLNPV